MKTAARGSNRNTSNTKSSTPVTKSDERRAKNRKAPGYPSRKGEKLVEGLSKSELCLKYGGKVRIIAAKIASKLPDSVDIDDLISVGFIGLMNAAEKFDPAQGVKFETFAGFRIHGAIIDELRSQDWVPRSVRTKAKQIEKASAEVELETGKPASESEVSKKLGMSRNSLQRVKGRVGNLIMVHFQDEDRFSMEDAPVAPGNPIDELSLKEAREELTRMMGGLSDNERLVVSCYYFRGLRLKEIADIMDLSEPRVSQLHSAAIRKLRQGVATNEGAKVKDIFMTLLA